MDLPEPTIDDPREQPAANVATQHASQWRKLLLIGGLTAAGYVLVWTWPEVTRGYRVIATAIVALLSALAFGAWVAIWSNWTVRRKWIAVALAACALVLTCSMLRVRAYTGNLVPILAWRWSRQPAPLAVDVDVPLRGEAEFDPTPGLYDSPGFLGAGRRGEVDNVRLSRDWSSRPPRLLWRRSIGEDAGMSSFAVVGRACVTQQQAGSQELVVCYELHSGEIAWTHADDARLVSRIAGTGPRATPSIDGRRVYTLGATGILNCLELKTGKLLWRRNVVEEHNATVLRWGMAASPLIVDNLVVVTTGHRNAPSFATLAAYDKFSGALVWTSGDDNASYSSPTMIILDGRRQIVAVNAASVTSHEPATGEILWRRDWPAITSNTSQPAPVSLRELLVSKGYGVGAVLWRVEQTSDGRFEVDEVWRNARVLKTKATSAIVRGKYAYGLSDGLLECVDLASGARQWITRGFGHGQVILVDDMLLVQAESGAVALVEANPAEFREVARFAALSSRTWNYPVLSGSRLLVRNDTEIACYELPLAAPLAGSRD